MNDLLYNRRRVQARRRHLRAQGRPDPVNNQTACDEINDKALVMIYIIAVVSKHDDVIYEHKVVGTQCVLQCLIYNCKIAMQNCSTVDDDREFKSQVQIANDIIVKTDLFNCSSAHGDYDFKSQG